VIQIFDVRVIVKLLHRYVKLQAVISVICTRFRVWFYSNYLGYWIETQRGHIAQLV